MSSWSSGSGPMKPLKMRRVSLYEFLMSQEFVLRQLRTTANLRLSNPLLRFVDFLMSGSRHLNSTCSALRFHGDSLQAAFRVSEAPSGQVEHHLWPGMSFVSLREASEVLRRACKEPPGAVFFCCCLWHLGSICPTMRLAIGKPTGRSGNKSETTRPKRNELWVSEKGAAPLLKAS